jgi:hypothetical protein
MDLSAWLRNLGLGQYEQAFRDNAIGLDVLLQLTKEDLKEIGVVPVGHRRKLLDAIAALRVSASPASDGAREARVLSASPVDPIGERRQVTVLFADLAGYTAWGQQLDAEEVHALLEQFFDHADRVVQEHGGNIARHIGDCVMAVFGAPVSHDNDAERAARAALAIQAAIPEVSSHVWPGFDCQFVRLRRNRSRCLHIAEPNLTLAALEDGGAGDQGRLVTFGSLYEALAAGGEVVDDLGRAQAQAVEIDQVDVGALPGLQASAVDLAATEQGITCLSSTHPVTGTTA